MRIYEYECLACSIRFERRQSVHDDAIKVCPECNGQARKVMPAVGIIFKGSGFYITDSRSAQSSVKPVESAASDNGDKAAKPETGDKAGTSEKKEEAKTSAASESGESKSTDSSSDAT